MRDAGEFLTAFAKVTLPRGSESLSGVVAQDGVICARSFNGDFEVLVPEASGLEQVVANRVGSVLLRSGSDYRVDVDNIMQEGAFMRFTLAADRADLLRAFAFTLGATLPDELPIGNATALSLQLGEILRLLQSDSQPTSEEIKGLWAELWLIDASPDAAGAVRGWHGRANDKVDFEIGGRLIEVKCHEGRQRVHHLRLDQLLLRPDVTFIVSVCVASSPGGDSIDDLVQAILPRLDDTLSRHLIAQVMEIVGADLDLITDYRFDTWPDVLPVAIPGAAVPRPSVEDSAISMVSFRVDLTDVASSDGIPVEGILADRPSLPTHAQPAEAFSPRPATTRRPASPQ